MPSARACPDVSQYQRLSCGGPLSFPEKEALLAHLEGCDACATQVEALSANDTLVELIRQSRTRGDVPKGETIARLVKQLRELRPNAPAAGEVPTRPPVPAGSADVKSPGGTVPDHGTTPVQPHSAGENQDLCDFLAPPQAPDEIGRLADYRVLKVLGA